MPSFKQNALGHRALIGVLEEVVALVVHQDEGGEVLHGDLPYGFHAQFGKRDDFLRLNVV